MENEDFDGRDDNLVPDDPATMKYCPKCKKTKPLTEFFKRGKTSKYYTGYCKVCHHSKFAYDRIICPHCQEKIHFFAVDKKGQMKPQQSEFLKKVTKSVAQKLNKKRKYDKKIKKKDLRDLLKD